MSSEGKSLHTCTVISLDIVLLDFGARDQESFPTLKYLCCLGLVENIFSHVKM